MTVRDPYTGVERLAPRRPKSFMSRWWPVALFVVIAVAGGGAEWRNSIVERAPHPVPAASAPASTGTITPSAGAATALASTAPATTPQALGNSDLTRALDALNAASDRLSNYALLLIILAALQAIVLVCQLYLFGKQLQVARDRPK